MRSCTVWTLALVAVIAVAALPVDQAHGAPSLAEKIAALPHVSGSPEAEVPPPNDVCETAILIPCGNIALSGHTGLANNDYTITDTLLSCLRYTANGNDVVYKLDVVTGDSLWIDYTSTADGSIYMVTDCNDVDGTCVIGSDSALAGVAESLRWKFLADGTYYLILDSFGPGTSGAWTASGQLICGANPPPANDICANAPTLGCGIFSFSGNTEYATNDYTFSSGAASCFGQVADGADVVYKLDIEAGDSLWVDYYSHADGSVYIVSDCSDPEGTCVAGADNVGPFATEQLRHVFDFTGIYYLILDARDPGASGEWSAIGGIECVNPPPSNDVCASAVPLFCGSINLSGNTSLAHNDYYVTGAQISCTDYAVDGNDVVYQLFVREGYHLTLDFLSAIDGSVYIVSACDSVTGPVCLYGVDSNFEGEVESVDYTFLYNGIAYLIFDSFDLNSGGPWSATGSMSCVSVGVDPGVNDLAFDLSAAAPNPFRETTVFRYSLPSSGEAKVAIYDLQGRLVRTLVDRAHPPGRYHAEWNGRDDAGQRVGPGVYFARLSSNGRDAMTRMVFMH